MRRFVRKSFEILSQGVTHLLEELHSRILRGWPKLVTSKGNTDNAIQGVGQGISLWKSRKILAVTLMAMLVIVDALCSGKKRLRVISSTLVATLSLLGTGCGQFQLHFKELAETPTSQTVVAEGEGKLPNDELQPSPSPAPHDASVRVSERSSHLDRSTRSCS